MIFSTLRENDRDLAIFLKIWKNLNVTDQINLAFAIHDPQKCSKRCKGHHCPRSPIAKVLRLTAPREIQPMHCPICQILYLAKEFAGPCPIGWNTRSPIQTFNFQSRKMPILFIEDPQTNEWR